MLRPSAHVLGGLLMLQQQVQERPVLLDCLAAEAVDQAAAQPGAPIASFSFSSAMTVP